MRFDLAFERTFAHPIERVWRALIDPVALGRWLMETDFVPEAGREFRMYCRTDAGETEIYLCKLLELSPPRRMVWSWVLETRQGEGATTVAFMLEEVSGGTRLTIRHSGDRDPSVIEAFESGWPSKLDQLEAALQ